MTMILSQQQTHSSKNFFALALETHSTSIPLVLVSSLDHGNIRVSTVLSNLKLILQKWPRLTRYQYCSCVRNNFQRCNTKTRISKINGRQLNYSCETVKVNRFIWITSSLHYYIILFCFLACRFRLVVHRERLSQTTW